MIGLQKSFYSSFQTRLIFCHNDEIKSKFWRSTSQSVVTLRLLVTPAPLASPYATYNISSVVVSRKELSIPLLETRWPDNFNDCHYLVLSITSSGVALFFCRAGQANCSSSNRPQRGAAKQNKTKQNKHVLLTYDPDSNRNQEWRVSSFLRNRERLKSGRSSASSSALGMPPGPLDPGWWVLSFLDSLLRIAIKARQHGCTHRQRFDNSYINRGKLVDWWRLCSPPNPGSF